MESLSPEIRLTPGDEVLERIRALPADTTVLVDLDLVLFLESSSERFLDEARPAALARLLLFVLELLKPWRWLGGVRQRDTLRVSCMMCLFPWVLGRWRRRVAVIAAQCGNKPLIEALQGRKVMVVTYGFKPIVEPLVQALRPGTAVVACRVRRSDRAVSKLHLLSSQQPQLRLNQAAVITDSLDDADLLNACAHPSLVYWPGAHIEVALNWVYLPLYYSERIRKPGGMSFLRTVVQGELVMTWLAALPLSSSPLLLGLAMLLLSLSFWSLYDVGYADNDQLAGRHEHQHLRKPNLLMSRYGVPLLPALVWAGLFAAPGIALLAPILNQGWQLLAIKWALVLLVLLIFYCLYNRLARPARVQFFCGLHFVRAFALAVMVPVVLPGAFMLSALVLTRHMEDFLRKAVDRKQFAVMPRINVFALLWFLVLCIGYSAAGGSTDQNYWLVTAMLTAYGLVRARRELPGLWSELRWVWRYDDRLPSPMVKAETQPAATAMPHLKEDAP